MTGFGVVAEATPPMLLDHLRIPLKRITVIDFADREEELRPWMNRDSFRARTRHAAEPPPAPVDARGGGGLIIDLAWSIDCFDMLERAHNNEVLYVNASLESWTSPSTCTASPLSKSPLRLPEASPLAALADGVTAVIDHGANPAWSRTSSSRVCLILAPRSRANSICREPAARLRRLMKAGDFAALAREIGVRVIHCSEWTPNAPRAKVRTNSWPPERRGHVGGVDFA